MRKPMFLIPALLFLFATTRSFAQAEGESYSTAIGVKFWPGAISIKHFTSDNRALEGLASFWVNGFRFTGLYEIHGDVSGAPGLKWYVGPGAHIGVYNGGVTYHGYFYGGGALSLGVDGVLGLEYKFDTAPIAISVDVQPYLELVNNVYVDAWGGIGLKYTW
jgi:hypothetical protein